MSLEREERKEKKTDFCGSKSIEGRLADLIIYRNKAKCRIAELEGTVKTLLENSKDSAHTSSSRLRRQSSAPLLDQPFKEDGVQQISQWNKDLVDTVNELRKSMLEMETDAKAQIIVLKDEVGRLYAENEFLRRENDALKERVADDVLRQRQTNRVEMAFEKARMASRVRAAGLRRLESMEAVLMETHDDLYFVQRFDAAKLPVRDVTFVMHIVANMSVPHASGEEFTMNVYQEILLGAAKQHGGYHVCSVRPMEIFAFHSATAALNFSKACHVAVTGVAWPYRTTEIPHFAPVIDNGEVLYRGPRVHTCIYTCNPGSEVDPINGRSLYYGQEIRQAVLAAVQGAPVGEIVANRAWGRLFCKEVNIMNDIHMDIVVEVNDLREKMGSGWSVIAVESEVQDLFCLILPKTLERRRGLPPYYLYPTPRFLRGAIDVDTFLPHVINSIKGVKRLSLVSSQDPQHSCHEGWVDGLVGRRQTATEEQNNPNGIDLLSTYGLKHERANIISLCKKIEAICAFHEETAMKAEDWYVSRFSVIDPSETLFVCTVDIGDSALWMHVTNSLLTADEVDHLRGKLRSLVHFAGGRHDGVYVNGNDRGVLVFAFRYAEQVLRFATHVYTSVSQSCEKITKTDVSPMRAGITVGKLHSLRGVSTASCCFEDTSKSVSAVDGKPHGTGVTIYGGKAVTSSCFLCDSAEVGDILVVADVMQTFYATKTNLAGMEYNVVKECGRFLGSHSALVDVYSVLPKLYAHRRQGSKNENKPVTQWCNTPRRCVKSILQADNQVMRRADVMPFLLRHQQFMERGEAAMMAARDEFFTLHAHGALRLPWSVVGKSRAPQKEVGFIFCDAMDVSTIAEHVSDDMYKEIMAQYNHVVRETLLMHGGFIAKTNSTSAYIVVFNEPYRAMEAALQIQRQLLVPPWPNKLHTLEATLYVRSAKTGILLFRGVRAKIVVHVSSEFQYTRVGRGDEGRNAVHVFGPAVDTVAEFASLACGGEILMTPHALDNLQSTLHGSLLLHQVDFQTVTATINDQGVVASCVPKLLYERFSLFKRITPPARTMSSSLREKRLKRSDGGVRVWWRDANNCTAPLPVSRPPTWGKMRGSIRGSVTTSLLQFLDDILTCIKQETIASTDSASPRENLMVLTRDIFSGLSGIFRMVEEGAVKTPTLAPRRSTTLLQRNDTEPLLDKLTTATPRKKRSNADGNRGASISNNCPTGSGPVAGDLYKRALQTLDGMLKGVLQRVSRAVNGAGNSAHELVLPNLRSGSKNSAKTGNAGLRTARPGQRLLGTM